MRKQFDNELNKLNKDLIEMGHLVETAIENMIDSFKHQDKALAKEIIANAVSYTHLDVYKRQELYEFS